MFEHVSKLVTQGFAECSANIRSVATALTEKQRDDLSEMIRSVQNCEREKLQLVYLCLLLAFIADVTQTVSLQLHRERANSLQRHQVNDDGQLDEINADIRSIRQQLGRIHTQINEVLEEVRYACAEL